MCAVTDFLDLSRTLAGEYIKQFKYPWDSLRTLADFIFRLGKSLDKDYRKVSDGVWVHMAAFIAPSAVIMPPAVIGAGTEVRHCAYIRGGVLLGCGCVVGNSTELKNSVLSDEVHVPHFNYVGDSLLGYKSHMGAGSVISNVKADKSRIFVCYGGEKIPAGLKKFGAILGDFTEVGCGSVINAGAVVGRNTTIYPLSFVRGEVPESCIYKAEGRVVPKAPPTLRYGG